MIDRKDAAILAVIKGLAVRFNSTYSKPRQITILKLLKDRYGIEMCRRTLCYRLAALDALKITQRFRRHYKRADGQLVLRSTAYYVSVVAKFAVLALQAPFKALSRSLAVQSSAHNFSSTYQNKRKEEGSDPSCRANPADWRDKLPWHRPDKVPA